MEETPLWVELLMFLREEKRWWLAPLIGTLGLVSFLVAAGGSSGLMPFIYFGL